MFGWLRDWRRERILARMHGRISASSWDYALQRLPVLRHLSAQELAMLKDMAVLLAREKSIEPVGELKLDDGQILLLSLQAVLPVLHLGLDWYDGWHSIVVYPAEFSRQRRDFDEHGVVHEWEGTFGGEAWSQGGVYLSWADVRDSGRLEGYNVVIHELAHKLDMSNGAPDGYPPLHSGVDHAAWVQAFSAAWEHFGARLERGEEPPIDPYAATDPGEFFAVCSEYFFELPALLHNEYPAVYVQLRNFYRQHPLVRLGSEQQPGATAQDPGKYLQT